MVDFARGFTPDRDPRYFIDPDTPVQDSICPKCAGLYVHQGHDSHCLNCGFAWVKKVEQPALNRRICALAHCQNALDGKTYCKKHREEAIGRKGSREGQDTRAAKDLRVRLRRGPQALG